MWYIASEENQEYLAHHGVKGMKWGRRQNRAAKIFMGIGGTAQEFNKIKEGYTRANEMRRKGKRQIVLGTIGAGVASGVGQALSKHYADKEEYGKGLAASLGGLAGAVGGTAVGIKGITNVVKGNKRMNVYDKNKKWKYEKR